MSLQKSPATDFLALAKYLSCPVVLITAVHEGRRNIMVGTAAYASLDPLVLTTNAHKLSATGRAIIASKKFGISVASHEQLALVQKLTEGSMGLPQDADRFEYLGIEPQEFKASGTLYIPDSLASFDCELVGALEYESHSVMLGQVMRTASGSGVRPLIRYDRSYGSFNPTVIGADSYPV